MPFDNANYQPDDEVLRILSAGRDLIAKGWCRGPFATDAEGNEVDPTDDAAVSFCTAGAMLRLHAGGCSYDSWKSAREHLAAALPADYRPEQSLGFRVIHYSDRGAGSHAELIAWWDRAISARRAALVSA